MNSRSPRVAIPIVIAAGVVAATAASKAAVRRWQAADDPDHAGALRLPEGRELKVTSADGAVIGVSDLGDVDDPVVVLAHGWTNAREVWAPVAQRLIANGRRVVLYDQRGHGASTVGADGHRIDALADDLRAVLDELDLRGAVVAGHSMGGMTAQALVGRHPSTVADRVRALVLVATAAHGLGSPGSVYARRVLGSTLYDRALRGSRGTLMMRGVVGANPRYSHLVSSRDMFVATTPSVRVGFFDAMSTMDLRAGLAGLDRPTTVVIGSRDRLTPPPLGRAIASAIPDAKVVEFEDAGHMIPFERPDELAELILAQA